MRAVLIASSLLFVLGCASYRKDPQTLFVLNKSSLGPGVSQYRWWVDEGYVFAGEQVPGKNWKSGYRVLAEEPLTVVQQQELTKCLSWLLKVEPGVYDIRFEPGFVRLSHSPTYAIDYHPPEGRRVLVGDDYVPEVSCAIELLNHVLPERCHIDLPNTTDPYRLEKMPNQSVQPTPGSVTPRAKESESK